MLFTAQTSASAICLFDPYMTFTVLHSRLVFALCVGTGLEWGSFILMHPQIASVTIKLNEWNRSLIGGQEL
jgi:hypothetical protein